MKYVFFFNCYNWQLLKYNRFLWFIRLKASLFNNKYRNNIEEPTLVFFVRAFMKTGNGVKN